tara:strand:+ start:562 stop:939 length:378 start_codon:yes stop_codon:yes gene_type:complete
MVFEMEKNVLGKQLEVCSCKPITGWFRDGFCKYDLNDIGNHSICCVMNINFLNYSKSQGNDLMTPMPEYSFPGLKEGDHWCICLERWKEAKEDGLAPLLILEATNIAVLDSVSLEELKKYQYIKN